MENSWKKKLVYNIDYSLNEDNFEPIVYVMEKDSLKKIRAILVQKKNKNTKTLSWVSEFSAVTGRQRGCDTVYQPRSCLLPNTKAIDAENFDNLFHLFFDDELMNIIVYHTINKIKDTISHLKKKSKIFRRFEQIPPSKRD